MKEKKKRKKMKFLFHLLMYTLVSGALWRVHTGKSENANKCRQNMTLSVHYQKREHINEPYRSIKLNKLYG